MRNSSLICVATHHGSVAELLADAEFLALANRDGFLVELRLDFFSDLDDAALERALKIFAPNVLATFRHPLEGGRNPRVTDAERLRVLQRVADHGVKFIDIEARTPRGGFDKRGAQLILSHHDFERAPSFDELEALHAAMRAEPGVDIVKIAVLPSTIFDTLPLLQLFRQLQGCGRSAILLAMGEAGLWTRVLCGKFGAPLTYARGENTPGTAPGQLSWRQLDELYRYREIAAVWPVYGVIGNPIGHSRSPLMHNTALKALGLEGVYLPFKVEGDAAEFARGFEPLGLRGLSVTIPHKESVAGACDEVDSVARQIGALNTLVWKKGLISGYNTDAEAAANSLEKGLGTLADKKVLILGAGGAARAIVFGLKARGGRVYVSNRTHERAVVLAREAGATAVNADEIAELRPDAIVNATSVGMAPNHAASPLEESQLPKSGLVFDTVYNPLRTRLLDMSHARGLKTIEGLDMFVEQGTRQFELWTAHTAPRALMRQVVLAALQAGQ